jgi:tetratricopeptide (TPR) repeat protein
MPKVYYENEKNDGYRTYLVTSRSSEWIDDTNLKHLSSEHTSIKDGITVLVSRIYQYRTQASTMGVVTGIFTFGIAGGFDKFIREKVTERYFYDNVEYNTIGQARTARDHTQAERYAATAERLKAEANRLEGQTKINKLMDVITSYDRAIELNTAKAGEYQNKKASILEEIGDELYREGLEILEEAEEDVINGRYIEALEKFRQAEEKYKKALELGGDVQQHIVETRELIRVSHLFSETIAELERLKGLTDNEKKAEGLDSLLKSLQVGLEGINEGIELFAGIYEVKTAIENQINIYLESIVSSPEGHERYGHTIVLSVTGVTYDNELLNHSDLLKGAYKIGGMELLNLVIDLGQDKQCSKAVIDRINSIGLEDTLLKILNKDSDLDEMISGLSSNEVRYGMLAESSDNTVVELELLLKVQKLEYEDDCSILGVQSQEL